MKTLLFSTLICSVLLFSCQKEKIETGTAENYRPEIVDPSFYNTEIEMGSRLSDIGPARGLGFYGFAHKCEWKLKYKLAEGIVVDKKVFYPIRKKWEVNYLYGEYDGYGPVNELDKWTHQMNYSPTYRYYRYNNFEKKSYIYNGLDDSNPRLIMDFNLVWEDEYVVDMDHGIYFVVDFVSSFKNNGVEYPLILGHYKFENASHGQISYGLQPKDQFHLSPFNPNPYHMMEDFVSIYHHDWEIFANSRDDKPPEPWIPDYLGCLISSFNSMWIRPEVDSTFDHKTPITNYHF